MLGNPRWLLLIAVIAITLFAAACGGNQGQLTQDGPGDLIPGTAPQLAWPPAGNAKKTISDDSISINGRDFAASGGKAQQISQSVKLSKGVELPWAMYAVDGFVGDIHLAQIDLTFTQEQVVEGQSQTWLALSSYSQGAWEWHLIDPAMPVALPDLEQQYAGNGGTMYITVVHWGPGSSRLEKLTLSRSGEDAIVPPPQQVVAIAKPGQIDFVWSPIPYADGYNIYRSDTDDFGSAVKRNGALLIDGAYSDKSVVPLQQYYYWLTTQRSIESLPSVTYPMIAAPLAPDVPENLSANAQVGSVQLSWDPVPNAEYYHVYRSLNPNFNTQEHYQALENGYNDLVVSYEKTYYYRVSSQAIEESEPCQMISVWTPSSTLPAPENVRALPAPDSMSDWVTLAWDYDPSRSPSGFRLFIDRDPDFPLDGGYLVNETINSGAARSHVEYDLPAGETLYVRIYAFAPNGQIGQLSPAIPFTVDNYWTWAIRETIGPGLGDFETIVAEDDLTAAYCTLNEIHVARRNAGVWTVDTGTGLDTSFEDWGFPAFVDIAYGGGQYIVGGQSQMSADMWVSHGRPGEGWTRHHMHGGGETFQGRPASGVDFQVGASDTEFAVTHSDIAANELLLHRRPISGSDADWTEDAIRTGIPYPAAHSLIYYNGELNLLTRLSNDLLYGRNTDEMNDFIWANVSQSGGLLMGRYGELVPHSGALYTPVIADDNDLSDGIDVASLRVATDRSGTWEKTLVRSEVGPISSAYMISASGSLFCLYNAQLPQPRWYYSVSDDDGETWKVGSVVINDFENVVYADLVSFNDLPYIVYSRSGTVYGIQGVPPAGE